MYADRYAPKRVNRGSLGMSVTIVGGLVAAAMLSNPTLRKIVVDRPIEAYPVPIDPPPPVDLPKPQPKSAARPTPITVDPIVDPPVKIEQPIIDYPPQPPIITPGEGLGGGGAGVVEPVKPPPPVLTGTEIDPRYARDFQPVYPPAEQRAGRDGTVVLKVLVGVDGRVVRAEQLTATSDEFWRVTLKQALGRWRFKPATRDGIPYEAWRTMTVRFRLDDQ